MSKRKTKNHRKPRFFSSQLEALEARVLLTGDTFSEWQNPVNPFDVNQDQHVTPKDGLFILQALNKDGAHALPPRASSEPGTSETQLMLDPSGDGYLSAKDALLVVQALNAQGEGEEFRLRLDTTNGVGDVVNEVNVGDTFTLNAYVQDLRGADAKGVFAAYLDVTYDASIVSVPQGATIVHAEPYDDGKSGSTIEPGVINEVGGFDQSATGDGTERLLFQLNFQADASGLITFQPNAADDLPINEFLANDNTTAIDAANILFDGVQLNVVDTASSPDLAGFAKALDAAGVEFWSTRQFNTDAVSQRDLFEDAEVYLPVRESFDSDGVLNTAATARNVTEVNTWIFPDTTRATGVLSLEEISTRSGVAITANTGPTLKQVVANDAVELELNSPLQLGLDAYDAANGPVTYTITADDPGLVESTLIAGNRGWELEIEGYGKMVFEFFEGRAPRATSQFITLTESGFFDGLTLHRILEDFVIQGGDPRGDGTGGSDLPDFDDQFHVDLQHNQIGVLSMAKSGDDTNNSQFFVTDATTRHLDFNHTIFGQLIEGFDVLDAVSAVDASQAGSPAVPVIIKSARVIDDTENAVVMLRALEESGTTNVIVTATDQFGDSDTQTFEVSLIAPQENAAPFLYDIPDLTASAGVPFEFQLEHIDIENDPVVYSVFPISPSGVTASVTDGGLVTVNIPDSLNEGDDVSVRVRVAASSNSARDEQVVTILIKQDTVAADDAFTIDEDSGPHTFSVLDNDEGSGELTIFEVNASIDIGTVEITNDDKQITFTPALNFPLNSATAQDAIFTYSIRGADSSTSTATVMVTVNPINDPPVANDDSFPQEFSADHAAEFAVNLREDSAIPAELFVIQNDNPGPDGENFLFINSANSDTGATVELIKSRTWIGYTPAANVFGQDTFTYAVEDPTDTTLTATATVTVTIAQVNDAPVTTPDTVNVAGGVSRTITAAELIGNDSAGPLEDAVQTLSISSVTQPTNGTVTLNVDGTLTYVSNGEFSGADSFEYTVTDNGQTENFDETTNSFVASADPLTATGLVTIMAASSDFAVDDTYTIEVDETPAAQSLDVLANDVLTLSPTITAVSVATSGTVEIINNGADIAYTANVGFRGSDSFTYTITDSEGSSSTATVSLTVQQENEAPEALNDSFTVQSNGTAQSLDVLANDTKQDGETNRVIGFLDQPDNGSVSISASGDAVLYTPNAGFIGTDSFVYQMDDGRGGMDAAQVILTVESTNQSPVAVDDSLVINGVTQQTLDVLANDTTEDGETLTIASIVTIPSNGVASIASDGLSILYEPIDDDVTEDSLVYQINDGNGGIATATATIRVNVNPVAQDDTETITGEQTLDVLVNDTTEDGETLTVVSITVAPTKGTATISTDGSSIVFTPNAGETGADALTYQISDGNGGTDTAEVALTLDVVNLAPVANDDAIGISPFGEQTLDVLGNDVGEAGETLTITAIGGSPAGTVSINSDGTGLLYTPAANAFGSTDTFTYTIDDGQGETAEATVTLSIGDLANSFFAGSVFHDMNNDGQQSETEHGIGGVMVVLSGTDLSGNAVRQETTSALDGKYRFEGILPGDYTVAQIQPQFLRSGTNTFGLTVTQEDDFGFQVSEQLIASDNNSFAERGISPRFALLDSISSRREPGLFVVLDGDELAWVESRGGWDDVTSLTFSRNGDQLSIESSGGNGTLSMTDRGMVELIGSTGSFTILRINGNSEAVLSAAAVDEVMAG